MIKYEYEYVECQCESVDHIMRFVIDEEEDEVYVDVQLSEYQNIFKRFWLAIRYICGCTEKYGHWDVTLLKNEDRERIIEILKIRKK